MRLALFLALSVSLASGAVAGSIEERVDKALEALHRDDCSVLVTSRYTEAPTAYARLFAQHIATVGGAATRAAMVRMVASLAQHGAGGPNALSRDAAVAKHLSDLLTSDPDREVREAAALALRLCFHPDTVHKFAEPIRAAAWRRRGTDAEAILLYGVLPPVEPPDAAAQIRALCSGQPKYTDWLLARRGDPAATGRLCEAAKTAGNANTLFRALDALVYAGTPAVQSFLARGLRSEAVVYQTNGVKWPRRDLYAGALTLILFRRQGYPLKRFGYRNFSDEELGRLEAWCTEHLQVRFPDTPRKSWKELMGFAGRGRAPKRGAGEPEVQPKLHEDVMAQLTTAIWSRDTAARAQAWKELRDMKAAPRLLETLAYGLTSDNDKHRIAALLFLREPLPDKRLVPSLIACIRGAEGETLVEALITARFMHDPALIPAILEHGVTSPFYYTRIRPSGRHPRRLVVSAFGQSAKALHVITNGRIGLPSPEEGPLHPREKPQREKLIAEWRAWREANEPKDTEDGKEARDAQP